MNKRYQPSNGSEASEFHDTFCAQCLHCDPDPEREKQCDVMARGILYDIKDTEYPDEWVYDDEDNPTCTKWHRWDWMLQGAPDDTKNTYRYQPEVPENPDQFTLF